MTDEQAREVLEKQGIFVTGCGMFAHRASVAIAPAVIEAMLTFAATAREQALREAAEVLAAKADGLDAKLGHGEFLDTITRALSAMVRSNASIVLSLITEQSK